jgi:D-hydroxyproline dehydrogenase subunit gamma
VEEQGARRIATIERRERIPLRVNGIEIEAYRGESVLAALLAAGYWTMRRSAVLRECRGPLCGMGVCYECLVTIDDRPRQRACMVEAMPGMEIVLPAATGGEGS